MSPRSSRWGTATACPSTRSSRPAQSSTRHRPGSRGSPQRPGLLAATWNGSRRSTSLGAYLG
eukprot:4574483-Lingulodinium_polyedra.AAC.1